MAIISTYKNVINYLFLAIELAGLMALFVTHNHLFIGMIIGNFIFWVIYLILEAKWNWCLPLYIRIMVILSIIGNGILGGVFKLYLNMAIFDQLLHVFASYSVAIWVYYLVQQFAGVVLAKRRLHFVIIFCLALALGAVYEIMEFGVDHMIQSKHKNQASLYDTDLDLISDLIGGLIASFHFVLSSKLNQFLISLKRFKGDSPEE
ncbi:hypothetical protein PU629_03890 [Pullulanibacillus sp. KACC 23026]|uniref:hypothetical protein n=1 Tax=Pullulanibacillus sp. KACC 23026 TaxID=3028315 RepID=UPI0023AFFAD7|nr:hypothetical protein [Pullulanibacillus sp. KACC 23026]WEG13518.1 hypothetical protein PU629_03890 [Pullulanibacillus sp. KACC 23026]